MELKLEAASIKALSSANTPEEAAKIFKAAVTQALAEVIATALDKTLGATKLAAVDPKIAGWEQWIGGMAVTLMWDRSPSSITNTGHLTSYASLPNVKLMGGAFSVGVSISGTF